MILRPNQASDVFDAREIARAAGSSTADAEALLVSGAISTRDGRFVDAQEAVRAVHILKGLRTSQPARQLFRPAGQASRRPGAPLTAAGLLHVGGFALILMLATTGVVSRATIEPLDPARLVFLVQPGPGGGGGGGGLKQPTPPRPAMLKGKSAIKSPVPLEKVVKKPEPDPPKPKPEPPPEVKPVERPVEPPPPVAKPDPVPPVVAPVVSAPDSTKDQAGVLAATAPDAASQGSGSGGGAGTGSGSGIGEGSGAGIGPGTGAGTGGGPYRPGSGITAPALVHEVKPDYTEEARRRNLAGDVVLEIVVRSDGRVGNVRVTRGLGAGLDQRAVEAVRQWRFTPARRLGTPVDVLVEVAVEFRMR
jgi:TonB family protein